MTYWQKRIDKEQDKLYNARLNDTNKGYVDIYKTTMNDIENDISKLYDKLIKVSPDGIVRNIDLYTYNRYYELQAVINKKLRLLGQKEINIITDNMISMYNKTSTIIGKNIPQQLIKQSFVRIPDDRVQQLLNYAWCNDGKNFSQRIWGNKALLQQRLEKGFTDSITRGLSKDEIVKQLQKDFGVGFNQADKIARTELTYIQNQATSDSYQKAGIKQYKFISAHDKRTSDMCEELDGKIFDFANKQVGINFPPIHPHCRSTIIAVI